MEPNENIGMKLDEAKKELSGSAGQEKIESILNALEGIKNQLENAQGMDPEKIRQLELQIAQHEEEIKRLMKLLEAEMANMKIEIEVKNNNPEQNQKEQTEQPRDSKIVTSFEKAGETALKIGTVAVIGTAAVQAVLPVAIVATKSALGTAAVGTATALVAAPVLKIAGASLKPQALHHTNTKKGIKGPQNLTSKTSLGANKASTPKAALPFYKAVLAKFGPKNPAKNSFGSAKLNTAHSKVMGAVKSFTQSKTGKQSLAKAITAPVKSFLGATVKVIAAVAKAPVIAKAAAPTPAAPGMGR